MLSEPLDQLSSSPQSSAPRDRVAAVWCAAAIYAGSMTLPNVMPALVGIFADNLHFDGKQLGTIAAAYPFGLGLMAVTSCVWIRRANWRLCIASGMGVLAVALGLLPLCADFRQILALMFAAGLGGGLAASPSLTALGDGNDPQRNFGVMILLGVLLPAMVLALVTTITGQMGYGGVFFFLATLFALSALLVPWIPKHGRLVPSAAATIRSPAGSTRVSKSLVKSLSSMIPFVAGYVAAWTFWERLGTRSGLSREWVLDSLAIGGVLGGLGGFLATWLTRVVPLRISLLVAIGVTVLTLVFTEAFTLSPTSYLVLATSFQLWVNVNFSNIMTFIAIEDEPGYSVGLIPSLQCFGASLGSVLAGIAFDGAGQLGIVTVAITGFLSCSGLMMRAFPTARPMTTFIQR